jgi:hypothetical protein
MAKNNCGFEETPSQGQKAQELANRAANPASKTPKGKVNNLGFTEAEDQLQRARKASKGQGQ